MEHLDDSIANLQILTPAGEAVRLGSLWAERPLLLVLMAGLGLGIGIIVSSLTTRYRDLQFLVAFGAQLLMYATTVIYPLSAVPEKYRWVLVANPMTPVVETFRYAFLGQGTVEPAHLGKLEKLLGQRAKELRVGHQVKGFRTPASLPFIASLLETGSARYMKDLLEAVAMSSIFVDG